MVRDFFKTKPIISIDNDDLEPFFTAESLEAFDHQELAINPKGLKLLCNATKQEIQLLAQAHEVERVLFLLFLSSQHELQISELDGFSQMGLAEDVLVSFGIGTQETENMRLVTLVLTKTY